jgi:lysophospholipase L1-like esterase
MQMKLIILFIIFIFLLVMLYVHTRKEHFTTNASPVIVLVGDSLLRNNSYVPYGESVSDWLQQKQKKCLTLASDGATIRDVYTQLQYLPLQLNVPTTTIVVSVGGNDFLRKQEHQQEEKTFEAYITLLETIQGKWNRTRIILLSLFCPKNKPHMFSLVDKWNNMQSRYANSKNIQIIAMDSSHKQLDNGIEPTSEGGKIIANQIIAASTVQ